MYLCYIDESGTPQLPGNTTHYVLAGLSIPVWHWKNCDQEIRSIKSNYNLQGAEIHVGWILRQYSEQYQIPGFELLDFHNRRYEVAKLRKAKIFALQKTGGKKLKQTRKNYRKTKNYIHLTYAERKQFILDIASCVSQWGFARLFAECLDKIHFDPARTTQTIDEQSFEQVVSRFEQYLENINKRSEDRIHALLIHDNNPTVERKLTDLMKSFYREGTFFTRIQHIIEAPLFVDSALTSMVQIADLCSYALRRYLENGEEDLFDLIFERADRKEDIVVGVRHFTKESCSCKICQAHRIK